jgi:hypothetical protein
MRLEELQRHFQGNVLHGEQEIVALVIGTEDVPATTRLAIYSEGYRLRLIDALASNMPRLQQLMGEQEFAALANAYIDECPSTFRSIRWFGDRFAESLARSHASQPWIGELARWEWAVAAAFDASDAPHMDEAALGELAPDEWPELTLRFHPSVQCVPMSTNAPILFKALADDLPAPAPVVLDATQRWLIWRPELTTQFRSLDESEAATLDLMRSGGTFEAMCELLCDWHDPAQVPALAAGTLRQWIADRLPSGIGAGRTISS